MVACQNADDGSDEQSEAMASKAPEVVKLSTIQRSTASTRTLVAVTDSASYQAEDYAQAISSWPMMSYAGESVAKVMAPMLNFAVKCRVPVMDELFAQRLGTPSDSLRQWQVERYVFTYNSVSGVTGNDTVLVGSVVFPNNTLGRSHEVDMLTLYHHQAYYFESWLPSQSLTLMAMHALHNSAVIEPDAQGAEWNLQNLIASYAQGDLTALQMVDCVLAALEVMRNHGVTTSQDCYSNNWGTSLGTSAATGFAQYMENDAPEDLQRLINLRASYIGEGPVMLSHLRGYENAAGNLKEQSYYYRWHPRLPFYISSCPNDELIKYDGLKEYYNHLRMLPNGTILSNVHWLDVNVPHNVLDKILNNHLQTAVLTLLYISMVEDPSDMEGVLQN
jgi:hypothetical protein